MTLQLDESCKQRLLHWARDGYPEERCGVLLGSSLGGVVRVEEVMQARNLNTERARDRYELDPADFLRADSAARERACEIVGIWHTHPDHPARPSATDRAQAWDGWSYLILSVGKEGVQAMRSWRLGGADFGEEPIRP